MKNGEYFELFLFTKGKRLNVEIIVFSVVRSKRLAGKVSPAMSDDVLKTVEDVWTKYSCKEASQRRKDNFSLHVWTLEMLMTGLNRSDKNERRKSFFEKSENYVREEREREIERGEG